MSSKKSKRSSTKKASRGRSPKTQAPAENGDAVATTSAAASNSSAEVAAAPVKKKTSSKPTGAKKTAKSKRISALDAAAQVIASTTKPMRPKEMIEQMEAKGLWKSPGGKTPAATLYAAIVREIAAKGSAARFRKHDRGVFIAAKAR